MKELARFKEFLNEKEISRKKFTDRMKTVGPKLMGLEENVVDNQWAAYVKSLVNDIRINGVEQYKDFTEDDILEDFENYVADKM